MTFEITIDGQRYPCESWKLIQQGETLRRDYNDGLLGGLGKVRERQRGDETSYFVAVNFDTTNWPYVRLVPATVVSSALTGFDMSKPIYHLEARDGGTDWVFIFNGNKWVKVNRSTLAISGGVQTDADTDTVFGRPALFEGVWYIPRSNTPDDTESATPAYATLNVAANTLSATASGERARHFKTYMQDSDDTTPGFAVLARAHTKNLVDFSPNAAEPTPDWSGGNFEIGDSSLGISDIISSQGELIIIKPDGPWRMDAAGNAIRYQEFMAPSSQASWHLGSNSYGFGPFAYWVHPSGFWRLTGDSLLPTGFDSDPTFNFTTDLDSTRAWLSGSGYGRWIYATRGTQFFTAPIEINGLAPAWHGPFEGLGNLRCFTTSEPSVWVIGAFYGASVAITKMALANDGSLRTNIGVNRGVTGATVGHLLKYSKTNFGRHDRQKQVRKLWALFEGMAANFSWQFALIRDNIAAASIGATIDSTTAAGIGGSSNGNGLYERIITAGTDDLALEAALQISGTSTGSFTGGDPRIRAAGIEARTAAVYRAAIPLTMKEMAYYEQGIPGSLSALRLLQNGQRVAIREPKREDTFNGYVLSVQEAYIENDQYGLEVFIERFDIGAGGVT